MQRVSYHLLIDAKMEWMPPHLPNTQTSKVWSQLQLIESHRPQLRNLEADLKILALLRPNKLACTPALWVARRRKDNNWTVLTRHLLELLVESNSAKSVAWDTFLVMYNELSLRRRAAPTKKWRVSLSRRCARATRWTTSRMAMMNYQIAAMNPQSKNSRLHHLKCLMRKKRRTSNAEYTMH